MMTMSTETQHLTDEATTVSEPLLAAEGLLAMPEAAIRLLTRERIEDIAFAPMSPDLRNELITRTYGDLAQAMADLLGTENATWSAFAQWASHAHSRHSSALRDRPGKLMALALSEANRNVFADIGWAHVVFLSTVGRAYRYGTDLDRAWRRCLDQLNVEPSDQTGRPPGGTENEFWASIRDPRPEVGSTERNQLLVLGLLAYRDAISEPDPERRARNILMGNCFLTLYEQRQLSTAISFGLRARVRTLTGPWMLLTSRNGRGRRRPKSWRIRAEDNWIHYATRHLISIRMLQRSIKVGRPVPPGRNPVPVIAREIEPIRHGRRPATAADNDELLSKLFWQLDVNGTPARCWNDVIDRVAYLAATLAYHQRDAGWFDADGRLIRPEQSLDTGAGTAQSGSDAGEQSLKRVRAALCSADLWPVNCPVDGSRAVPTDAADSRRQLQSFLAPQALWLTGRRRHRYRQRSARKRNR